MSCSKKMCADLIFKRPTRSLKDGFKHVWGRYLHTESNRACYNFMENSLLEGLGPLKYFKAK